MKLPVCRSSIRFERRDIFASLISVQNIRQVLGKWLAIFLVAICAERVRAVDAISTSPATMTETDSLWTRIVMIGASASAGFTVAEPFGGSNTLKYKLSYYVDAAIKPPHLLVTNLANAMFFLMPDGAGRMQISKALALQPTLMIGVDFPFWFCYGSGRTVAEQLQHFEEGLNILDAVKCPLVLGDIPNASYATNTGILSPTQVPSGEALAAANARLKEWAAHRTNVVVVPLAHFMSTVMANAELDVHGLKLPAGKSRAILQEDQLHPNARGAAVLALGILDALTAKLPKFSSNDVDWNANDIFQKGYEKAQAAIRAQANQSSAPPPIR